MSLEEDIEELPVPLSAEALRRLTRFARDVGKHPRDAAATLLEELLHDDEFYNAAAQAGRLN